MSYCTLIYGLRVQLNKQIPGIVPCEPTGQKPDIDIHLDSLPLWFDPEHVGRQPWYVAPTTDEYRRPTLAVWLTDNGYHLCYADGTQFLVDKTGTNIWASWPSDTLTLEDTATYLLGPIMGFVLLLRGRVSLHASAVAIENEAVAIVGPAGSGKSTTAAAFADLGYRVLSEDVVTLKEDGDSFWVQPGYPCIRLWPESVEALYGSGADLPRLTPTWEKRFLDLNQSRYRFEIDPLPLSAIYVVDSREDEDAPRVQPLSQAQALMCLVANTYSTNLMNREMRGKEFKVLTRLLETATVRRLIPHTDPARISDLCQTIVEDFNRLKLGKAPMAQAHFLHV